MEMYRLYLLILLIMTLTFGVGYAYLIKKAPIKRTYVEVIIGDGFTMLFVILGQLTLYAHFGYIPWWAIFFLPVGWALTGLPMSILQERKYTEQQSDADKVKNSRNGDEAEKEDPQ